MKKVKQKSARRAQGKIGCFKDFIHANIPPGARTNGGIMVLKSGVMVFQSGVMVFQSGVMVFWRFIGGVMVLWCKGFLEPLFTLLPS